MSENAMPEEGIVAGVRRAYEAFSRGDFDAAAEIADPDIELITTGGLTNLRGAEKFRAWMEPEAVEDVSVEVEHFEVAGSNVLVRQHGRGRGVSSGIIMDLRSWAVWTINEAGLVTRIIVFRDEEEGRARQAAGLPGFGRASTP